MSPWQMKLSSFLTACLDAQFIDSRAALQAYLNLKESAPEEFSSLLGQNVSMARLDKLCQLGADLTAAMEIVGPHCGILVSRSVDGSSSALVKYPGASEEGSFFGDDPATSLLAASAQALLTVSIEADGNGHHPYTN